MHWISSHGTALISPATELYRSSGPGEGCPELPNLIVAYLKALPSTVFISLLRMEPAAALLVGFAKIFIFYTIARIVATEAVGSC